MPLILFAASTASGGINKVQEVQHSSEPASGDRSVVLNFSDVLHDLNQEFSSIMEELRDDKIDVDGYYNHCNIIGGPAPEIIRNV